MFVLFVKDSWGNSEANLYILFDSVLKHKEEFLGPKCPSVLCRRANTPAASEDVVIVPKRVCSVLSQMSCQTLVKM